MKLIATILAVLLASTTLGAGPIPQTAARPDGAPARPPTVFVTGANRGLGLEFARQFAEAGWRVIGTARRPDAAKELRATGARIVKLDVADAASVAAAARAVEGEPIDLLINNAGVSGRGRSLAELDLDDVARVLAVNTIGPMRVTRALLPNLRAGDRKMVVSISSGLGSIANNANGGYYGYRESKAALNMFTRTLAAELKPEGFTCIVMSPGWVRTDMGGPQATLSPEESIRGMRKVIDGLKPQDTGSFRGHDGSTLPW